MNAVTAIAIAAIIGIVVLCLIARDISREVYGNEELRVKLREAPEHQLERKNEE